MPRTLFPIEQQLRTQPTLDRPARQVALTAVNNMMAAATRAGVLLQAARAASIRDAATPYASVARNRSAVIAQDAYEARTSAEVAKYRAAFALMAEEHGNQMVRYQAEAAKQTEQSRLKRPLIDKAKYHGKQREMMLQASEAAGRALDSIPPLPDHIAPRMRTWAPDVGPGKELMAQPTFGWRPKKYNDLMGEFFPADVRKAAGGLSGTPGGGLGVSDTPLPTTEPWYNSLVKSIGFGVKAAGDAAQAEGNKASQDPGSADALRTGGSIVSALSNMLTGGVQQGQRQYVEPEGVSGAMVALVAGGVAVAGYIGWKLLRR